LEGAVVLEVTLGTEVTEVNRSVVDLSMLPVVVAAVGAVPQRDVPRLATPWEAKAAGA
tara:strand:+ start:13 stop:186 length:174 start_codon:yes stop_codon:yes gene_type:complete